MLVYLFRLNECDAGQSQLGLYTSSGILLRLIRVQSGLSTHLRLTILPPEAVGFFISEYNAVVQSSELGSFDNSFALEYPRVLSPNTVGTQSPPSCNSAGFWMLIPELGTVAMALARCHWFENNLAFDELPFVQ